MRLSFLIVSSRSKGVTMGVACSSEAVNVLLIQFIAENETRYESTLWNEIQTNTSGMSYNAQQLLTMYDIARGKQNTEFFNKGQGWCEAWKHKPSLSSQYFGFYSDWHIVLYKDLFILDNVVEYIMMKRMKLEFNAVSKTVAGPNINTINSRLRYFLCTEVNAPDSGWAFSYLTTQRFPNLR